MLPEFKTILDLLKRFPDEKSCHQYLASRRWQGYMLCPFEDCDNDKAYVFSNGIHYKCTCCRRKYTARTGTIFAESKVPLVKWFLAMYLLMHKKGISSVQLGKDIGVSQTTAWFLLHRIRAVLGNETQEKLEGIVEIDESFVGGKNKNRHRDKKYNYVKKIKNFPDKVPVFGMLERGGKVRAMAVPTVGMKFLRPIIYKNIQLGSTVLSDEYRGYQKLQHDFHTDTVCHSKGLYGKGWVSTNTIENFWSHLKRSIIGIYIKVDKKYLNNYVQECAFRYNYRNLGAQEQIDQFISKMETRLTYKMLTANHDLRPETI